MLFTCTRLVKKDYKRTERFVENSRKADDVKTKKTDMSFPRDKNKLAADDIIRLWCVVVNNTRAGRRGGSGEEEGPTVNRWACRIQCVISDVTWRRQWQSDAAAAQPSDASDPGEINGRSVGLASSHLAFLKPTFHLTRHVTSRTTCACRAHTPTFPLPIIIIFLRKLSIWFRLPSPWTSSTFFGDSRRVMILT